MMSIILQCQPLFLMFYQVFGFKMCRVHSSMVLMLLSEVFGIQAFNLCMVCTIHNLFYDDVYEEEGDFTTDIDDKIRSLEEVINTFINEDFPK